MGECLKEGRRSIGVVNQSGQRSSSLVGLTALKGMDQISNGALSDTGNNLQQKTLCCRKAQARKN